jgi:ferredoxin
MACNQKLLVCDCGGSMKIDAAALADSALAAGVVQCSRLCRAEVGKAEQALSEADTRVLIACGQESALFAEMAAEHSADLVTADIRDRAGWTADRDAGPKQAALLAEALLTPPATPVRDIASEGICLVLGDGAVALAAARRLGAPLAVTCLLPRAPEDLVPQEGFDLALGSLRSARGALGRFEVVVDGYAPLDPTGRGALGFEPPRDGAVSGCDIILDLRGGPALFPAPEKRDGYLRADPGDAVAVERALYDAAQLVGTFEKPLHIRFHAEICAHSRARQTGCTRCLDVCPTGAITPDGDTVAIDPWICAGCGACAAVCPSGAAAHDDPPAEHLWRRLRTLAHAYCAAGGTAPRALFHDAEHGGEMIRLAARFGRGLPADVIPVEVANVEGVGHAELLAALGAGFAEAIVLAGPRSDRAALEPQLALARAIVAGAGRDAVRVALIDPGDPDAFEAALYGTAAGALDIAPILPLGGRREVTRLAATALAGESAAPIPLPEGAPYGAIVIDKEVCSLCLACVSL